MKTWDPGAPTALVGRVPLGCRAVPVVRLVERSGELVEVRDRRRRRKTDEVALLADGVHPAGDVDAELHRFAVSAARRRWTTAVNRFGEGAYDVAISLVRSGAVALICAVDERGDVGEPRWLEPTEQARAEELAVRKFTEVARSRRDEARRQLVDELRPRFPDVGAALSTARSPTAIAVLTAAACDLLAGIEHAGPRAFSQAHFGHTKAHDVRAVLAAAGLGEDVLGRLGLRRGDRIGLGGPMRVTTDAGTVDLNALRGPVVLRLDQPGLAVSTEAPTVLVLENLQPAEVVCARHPGVPVVYTAGQFDDAAASLFRQLHTANRRLVVIVDADLGGVRIARRLLDVAPTAEIVDVGQWSHPVRSPIPGDGSTAAALRTLGEDPLVGWFAAAVLRRGYPVEQEAATLEIVTHVLAGDTVNVTLEERLET